MPESPQVQALAEYLAQRCTGATLASADLAAISVLKTADPPMASLVGAVCTEVTRYGKFLALGFLPQGAETQGAEPQGAETQGADAALHLVIHLARAGWLRWSPQAAGASKAGPRKGPLMLRMVWVTDGGEIVGTLDMTEAGTRKSSSAYVVGELREVPGIARLGPDPLRGEVSADRLREILAAHGGAQIKGVLRDQAALAGIGNAYSDEILHRARLSPFLPCRSLTEEDLEVLHKAIRDVLGAALETAREHEPKDLKDDKRAGMAVHGRTGEACPVCGGTVAEVAFAESSLQYCPTCQTGGKKLADRRMSRLLK